MRGLTGRRFRAGGRRLSAARYRRAKARRHSRTTVRLKPAAAPFPPADRLAGVARAGQLPGLTSRRTMARRLSSARPAWRRRPVRCLLWQARCGAGLRPRCGIPGTNPRTKRTREPPRRRRGENASRVPGAGTDHPQNAPPRTSRTPPGFVWCSLSFSTFPLLSARAHLASACSLSGTACIPP